MTADFFDDDDNLFFAEEEETAVELLAPWKVLIVDDEPDIHQVTKFAIQDLVFEERPLLFLHAYSGKEANEMVASTPDIALILLDVVMESQTAGLEVAKYVRDVVDNHLTRIILRTGQPGYAPEAKIILDYDINDYKNKTELSKDKLCTTVIAALRGYGELIRTESYRCALTKIMEYAEQLLIAVSLEQFYDRLNAGLNGLLPLSKLYNLQPVSFALLEKVDGQFKMVRQAANIEDPEQWISRFTELFAENEGTGNQFKQTLALLPVYNSRSTQQLYLLVDNGEEIDKQEKQLLGIFAHYVEIANANLSLQLSLSLLNTELEGKVHRRTDELNIEKQKAEHANQAKSQFLANMSHEIRTPMNAILGFTQLLVRSSETTENQRITLMKVDKAGNHLMEIINDVLEISKIEAGAMELKMTSFDLGALLDDVGQMFNFRCEQKAIDWQFDNQVGEQIAVIGDQGKLRQILINLLGNAVKFTDTGFVRLTVTQPDPHAFTFYVIDSGPGIQADELSHLFSNFAQGKAGTDKGGTGLGLAISNQQIGLLGGKIEVESTFGQGSRFSFTIQMEPSSELFHTVDDYEVQNIRVVEDCILHFLVVDDVEANRDVLGGLLAETGVTLDYANDGASAIEKIRNSQYDLVFMDILMPIMRGDKAIELIRNELKQPDLVCVAISAFSLAHEIEYYIEIGFDEFIPKPFLFSEIYSCLDKFFPGKFIKIMTYPVELHSSNAAICLADYQLSNAAHNALINAAEQNRLSYIKEFIDTLVNNEPDKKDLGRHLLTFIENYDMEGFMSALKEVGSV